MLQKTVALSDRASPFWLAPTGRKAASQETIVALALYFVAALAIRSYTFGNPVLHIDEQFYLLVGDRMLHGAIPFVDIWDRKPIGLFLIYAGIRMLGGFGILQYQAIALLFAVATAGVIYRIARLIASPTGAWCSGVGYLFCLSAFNCYGGQSPVFYNAFVALAALSICDLARREPGDGLFWRGMAAMAMIGLAIQIKYTVVFEGLGFGLALIWYAHRQDWTASKLALATIAWSGTALLPTALALGWYAARGHGQEFIFANFLSIFNRHESTSGACWRLTKEMLGLLPVWLAIFRAPFAIPRAFHQDRTVLIFLRYWAAVAMLGFLVFGTWYDHYVGPVLVPLLTLCAPALGRPRGHGLWYTVLLLSAGILAAWGVTRYNVIHNGTTDQVERAASIIDRERAEGCVYINEGDPILYHYTGSCLVTRFIFPNHLNSLVEANSMGIDTLAEVHRIMEGHPQVVVMTQQPSSLPINPAVRNYMFEMLNRDYRLVDQTKVGWRTLLFYRLQAPVPGR